MKKWILSGLTTLLLVCGGTVSQATMMINEVFTNPPGTDTTQEFFELKSSTGGVEAMTGLHLLVVEGEGATDKGTVDQAFSLNAFSTGTNGLFYWRANVAVGSFSPAPEAASTVNTADFSPDLENGTQTYLLVSGFSGAVGNDLDSNNDGTLESTPWTGVVDAIGYHDTTVSGEFAYATQFGFEDFPVTPSGFEFETIFRLSDTDRWVGSDIAGVNPGGPYSYDATETIYTNGSPAPVQFFDFDDVSPGSTNPAVPEPTTIALVGLGLVGTGIVGRRRRG